MAITRRQFIKRSSLVAAGSLLGPGLLANPFMRKAFASLEDNDRYFVVIFLDGGNDGLNTVVPTSGPLRMGYESARGTGSGGLRLTAGDLANTAIAADPGTGTQLALHPGFLGFPGLPGDGGLHDLYLDTSTTGVGKVAVVQGCGYPEYSLSHEESRVIWQTADPLGAGYATGWVGRHLAAQYSASAIPAVNIADSIVGEFKQTGTSVLAVRRLNEFDFPY